jgi:hypothetical protein
MSQKGKLRQIRLNRVTPLIGAQPNEPIVQGNTKDPRSFEDGLTRCKHGVLIGYTCCICHPEQKELEDLG